MSNTNVSFNYINQLLWLLIEKTSWTIAVFRDPDYKIYLHLITKILNVFFASDLSCFLKRTFSKRIFVSTLICHFCVNLTPINSAILGSPGHCGGAAIGKRWYRGQDW